MDFRYVAAQQGDDMGFGFDGLAELVTAELQQILGAILDRVDAIRDVDIDHGQQWVQLFRPGLRRKVAVTPRLEEDRVLYGNRLVLGKRPYWSS